MEYCYHLQAWDAKTRQLPSAHCWRGTRYKIQFQKYYLPAYQLYRSLGHGKDAPKRVIFNSDHEAGSFERESQIRYSAKNCKAQFIWYGQLQLIVVRDQYPTGRLFTRSCSYWNIQQICLSQASLSSMHWHLCLGRENGTVLVEDSFKDASTALCFSSRGSNCFSWCFSKFFLKVRWACIVRHITSKDVARARKELNSFCVVDRSSFAKPFSVYFEISGSLGRVTWPWWPLASAKIVIFFSLRVTPV